MTLAWTLTCSACDRTDDPAGLPEVCPLCGAPWLVRYAHPPAPDAKARLATRPWTMWRYREWMPLAADEEPVTLGEGGTPLLPAPRLAAALGLEALWIKDESVNPTGSFKARGLSAAVTRAKGGGARAFTIPTAGNAGVALSAYAQRAGIPVAVFAPTTTPPRILEQMRVFGAHVQLLDGHIGDCGRVARQYAAERGAFDVSTLREPYRIEGKKTLGLEVAEQLGWTLPDVCIYPTGGASSACVSPSRLCSRRAGSPVERPGCSACSPPDARRWYGPSSRARRAPNRGPTRGPSPPACGSPAHSGARSSCGRSARRPAGRSR
jgi:threonine synthase